MNIRMMVSVDTEYGYRSGKSFLVNKKANIVDDYDWETAPSFVIYYWNEKPEKGGDDEYNDCLFKAFKIVMTAFNFPNDLKSPEELKMRLGLERED